MSVSEDKLKELIRSGLKEVIAEREREKEDQPKQTSVDHICECPDCFCSALDRMNKTSDYACSDCHLPLGNEAFVKRIEKCPNCGSQRAPRKVER